MLNNRLVKVPLSPRLCEEMRIGKVNPVYNQSKEDSWALGMTGLCAATGTTLDDYYD